MWAAWQVSVPAMGLTCLDHCHPGSNVARPTSAAPRLTSSSLPMPLSKSRVSSGEEMFLRIRCAMRPPRINVRIVAAQLLNVFRNVTSLLRPECGDRADVGELSAATCHGTSAGACPGTHGRPRDDPR